MRDLLTSCRFLLASIVVCGVVYPLAVLAMAELAAPDLRQGSLLYDRAGRVVGSRLIGQAFSRPEYFWPRPSAVNYDAAASGGSNLSPKNPEVRSRAQHVLARLELPPQQLASADLVSASGSGLDPHIRMSAAEVQVARVAKARAISEDDLQAIVARHGQPAALGNGPDSLLINVLELNLDLDRRYPLSASQP